MKLFIKEKKIENPRKNRARVEMSALMEEIMSNKEPNSFVSLKLVHKFRNI